MTMPMSPKQRARKLLPVALAAIVVVLLLVFWAEDAKSSPAPCAPAALLCDGFEGPAPVVCEIPGGFRVHEFAWSHLFFGAAWPNGLSTPVPVGSFSLRDRFARYGKPIAGKLITTRIIADDVNHRISWVGAQPIWQVGYLVSNGAESGTVTLSTCRADVYTPCQVSVRSGNLFYGPRAADPSCRTVAGQEYWLTFHFAPPDLDPARNTCQPHNASGGVRCDLNVSAR